MKLRNLQHLSGAAVAAAALTFVPAVLATTQADQSTTSSSQAPSWSSGGARVQVASLADLNAEAKNFDDAHVRSSDGKDLGKIRDFLVNPKSGQVSCAVVSSGGWAGIGNKLRVVPFSALQPAGDSSAAANAKVSRDFQVAITQAQWQQLPTIAEDQFEQGRVPMTSQLQQQLAQTFQTGMPPSAADASPEMTLMRVRKIRGQDLQANGQDIGRIDGVLIRPGQNEALAVVNPKADFASGDQKYLVPLTAIDVMGTSGNAQTQLTRQDFRSAQMSQSTAAMPAANTEPNASSRQLSSNAGADATSGAAAPTAVTPTGSASGFQSPDATAKSGNAAATSSTSSTGSTDNASQVKKD